MGGRQRLELPTGNSDVLLGQEFAMIEAGQMQGHAVQSHIRAPLASDYMQLLLDHHDCIRINGVWAETVFVGRLARAAQSLIGTHFAEFGGRAMPVHELQVSPLLQRHETLSLLDEMIA